MDDDGYAVHSRRRGDTTRGPAHGGGALASFRRDVSRYAGTSEDFEKAHARRYGREEGLGPDGKHQHGQSHFPRGSERLKLHTQYSTSTEASNTHRRAYVNGRSAADKELDKMTQKEREYYRNNTGGYAPHQHERLDPRAVKYRDSSLRNADNRKVMLKSHPHGYHSAQDQEVHYDRAESQYEHYEYASDQQKHHENYRSYSSVDPRRDQWGRPVSHR